MCGSLELLFIIIIIIIIRASLYRAFTIIYLKQTIFLGYVIL
jgi:hypothetical protein